LGSAPSAPLSAPGSASAVGSAGEGGGASRSAAESMGSMAGASAGGVLPPQATHAKLITTVEKARKRKPHMGTDCTRLCGRGSTSECERRSPSETDAEVARGLERIVVAGNRLQTGDRVREGDGGNPRWLPRDHRVEPAFRGHAHRRRSVA